MRKRKTFAVLLALVLALTGAMPAFAAQGDSDELAAAITFVKGIAEIPEAYSEFQSYNYIYENEEGESVSVWSLEWFSPDGNGYAAAEVEAPDRLLGYYQGDWTQEESALARVSRAQAQETAEAFLQRALPELAGDMREVDGAQNAANTYSHQFSYQLYAPGTDIPVQFLRVEIWVDRHSGIVTEYYYDGPRGGRSLPALPESSGAIEEGAAMEAYLSAFSPVLSYRSDYDYEEKTLTVFPVYSLRGGGHIDAFSGQVTELYTGSGDLGLAGSGAAEAETAADSEEGSFTPEELAQMDAVAGLLSQQAAERRAAEQVPGLSSAD
ncbi:MAG: hypothetical protein Q4C22_00325, partial [Bacillota bacterium]|nr:hypothetical protein [Bacillota bacterium]